jgi:serine/threonine-protein kinase HipA
MILDVHVGLKTVATLYRERDEYVLRYTPEAADADFVSLTMPVREQPWKWPRDLHPFFRQNLPEGYLLGVIREEFGPLLDGTDLSLLAVVGGTGIGRVTVTSKGVAPGNSLQPLDVEALLTTETSVEGFASLVRHYAQAAISGAMPKFLGPDHTDDVAAVGKSTLRTSRFIVKGSDDKTPFLGFNEFYSLRVLERLKVTPVANARMSTDGRLLIVDRFDLGPNGIPHAGLEDACSLLGLPPHEKYLPSMEEVLRATRAYIAPASLRSQLEHLGWQILTNYVVRNADCHSKNIAVYYTERANVRFTPTYDIVTTQAYPRYATNAPGLSIEGRKTWTPGKSLEQFFKTRLGIAPRDYTRMAQQVCESAVEVGREIIEAAKNDARWLGIGKQMLHVWNDGMNSLRYVKGESSRITLTDDINAAGFSDPLPPEAVPVIGHSELLARPRSRKAGPRHKKPTSRPGSGT